MGRLDHAAVSLWNGGDHSRLLVTGGRMLSGDKYEVLNDAWIFDLQAEKWKEVRKECMGIINGIGW